MKMAAKVEEKRKHDFFAKQHHHEKLREEHLRAQERDRELQARQHELMEQRRLMVLAQTRRDEAEKRNRNLRESLTAFQGSADLQRMQAAIPAAKEAANRWTDNIHIVYSWVEKKAGSDRRKEVKAFFKENEVDIDKMEPFD